MPIDQKYTLGFKFFFWIFWLIGLILSFVYIGFFIEIMTDTAYIIGSLLILLVVITQVITLYLSLNHFIQKTEEESHLLWSLARVTLGMPFVLIIGCVFLLTQTGYH
ncbi:MAG: hypothetical protein Q9M50_04560 [Methylococcales bacterium]|nr:hypothetical protein [Methylococcales bacterium]